MSKDTISEQAKAFKEVMSSSEYSDDFKDSLQSYFPNFKVLSSSFSNIFGEEFDSVMEKNWDRNWGL